MINFLNSQRNYTNRDYLCQFYNQDVLVVTDNDLENIDLCHTLVVDSSLSHRILDITHNPVRHWPGDLAVAEILTNNIDYYYNPCERVKFFPLFLWMFSLRQSLWWSNLTFDARDSKNKPIMCLNNQPRHHRTLLRQALDSVVDQMVYSFNGQGLPGENLQVTATNPHGINDVSIGHPVYGECAVNVVTETITDHAYLSEKTCKPFLAGQIPILVGGAGITRFCHNVGLDMFGDLIPWQTWDDEPVLDQRIKKIANFIIGWIGKGTMLDDYFRVKARVDSNKEYFHSKEFRDKIMWQMQS